MKKKLIKETNLYGVIPKISNQFNDLELYANDYSLPYVFLKKIQIWSGFIKNQMSKCLLGMKCWYVNYLTGEKQESEYHGCKLNKENIDTQELEVKEDDYFNKINLGISYYIIHFKITTKKGDFIEFGEIDNECEKKIELNPTDNMISSFSGYTSKYGVRSLKINYIDRVDFMFYPLKGILRLRYVLKKNDKIKKYYEDKENYNKLDLEMKYIYHVCLLPDGVLSYIFKYL